MIQAIWLQEGINFDMVYSNYRIELEKLKGAYRLILIKAHPDQEVLLARFELLDRKPSVRRELIV